MGGALKAGGQVTMMLWRTIDDGPCLKVPREVVERVLPRPGDDAQSCGPGPLSMTDEDMVRGQLEAAGYEEIAFERIDVPFVVAKTPEEAIASSSPSGRPARSPAKAGEEAERRHAEMVTVMKEGVEPYVTDEGAVMAWSSWQITARNPMRSSRNIGLAITIRILKNGLEAPLGNPGGARLSSVSAKRGSRGWSRMPVALSTISPSKKVRRPARRDPFDLPF